MTDKNQSEEQRSFTVPIFDMDSPRKQPGEQQVIGTNLEGELSKIIGLLENSKTRYLSEQNSWKQELDEARTKLNQAEGRIDKQNPKCDKLEEKNQRSAEHIEAEFTKTDALVSSLGKKQKTLNQLVSELEQRTNSLLVELVAAKDECRNMRRELAEQRQSIQRRDHEEIQDRCEFLTRVPVTNFSDEASGGHEAEDKSLRSRDNISTLMRYKSVNFGENQSSCACFGEDFKQKGALKPSQRRIHTGGRPYVCTAPVGGSDENIQSPRTSDGRSIDVIAASGDLVVPILDKKSDTETKSLTSPFLSNSRLRARLWAIRKENARPQSKGAKKQP